MLTISFFIFFFFNDTATTEIYTLPYTTLFRSTDSEDTLRFAEMTGVRPMIEKYPLAKAAEGYARMMSGKAEFRVVLRSEEHTSELQSLAYLVCRLLLEKKKKKYKRHLNSITTL